MSNLPDATVEGHGTIYLVRPVSEAAVQWINEHVDTDAQRWGTAIAVEHRYIRDIVDGMLADGLNVEWTS